MTMIYLSASSADASGLYLYHPRPRTGTARSGRCQQCAHTHTTQHSSSSSSSSVFCRVGTMIYRSASSAAASGLYMYPPPQHACAEASGVTRSASSAAASGLYLCIHPRNVPAPKAQQCARTHTTSCDTVAAVSTMRFLGLYDHYHYLPATSPPPQPRQVAYTCTHPHVQHTRAAVSSALTHTQRDT